MPFNQIPRIMKSVRPLILKGIKGLDGKTNDIIYHPSEGDATGSVIYFGGDVQDYTENMMSHRDNHAYVQWNLENTSVILHSKFPTCDIFLVRAARMHLKTFSCYENFVDGNDFGAPNYSVTTKALEHLDLLLQNVTSAVSLSSSENIQLKKGQALLPISIIGFSKGCVVLNQLLHSFLALSQQPDEGLLNLVKRISVMYWLDGAHCGSSDTWVSDKAVLHNYSMLSIKTRIHVTPYQVNCDMRPRIGKEEKIFRENLRKMGADIKRTLHFGDMPKSLEFHFKVLEAFSVSD